MQVWRVISTDYIQGMLTSPEPVEGKVDLRATTIFTPQK